jgi:hypothetical protein
MMHENRLSRPPAAAEAAQWGMKHPCRPSSSLALLAVLTLIGPPAVAGSEPPEEAKTGAAVVTSLPKVELLEVGKEPRAAARYRLTGGKAEKVTVIFESSTRAQMGEIEMPLEQIAARIELETTISQAEGEYPRIESRVVKAGSIEESPEERSIAALMLRRVLRRLEGMQVRAVRDARGLIHGDDIELAPGLDAAGRQLAEDLKNVLVRTGIHLPEEPIGIGARWVADLPTAMQGAQAVMRIEYCLLSRTGDTLEVEVALGVSADRQAVRGIRLESLTGEGKGTASVDLRRAAALRLDTELVTRATVLVSDPADLGAGQRREQTTRERTRIQSSEAR